MHVSLEQAAEILLQNDVVAIPTETVYGLAAKFDSEVAVQKIYDLKNRPSDNPLIVHVSTLADAKKLAVIPEGFEPSLLKIWPGSLTVVVPAIVSATPALVRAGLSTIAIRIPNHQVTLALLKITGPLVAPSANKSGRPSSTCPEHVESDFGKSFPVLDGGACQAGVESTIVELMPNSQWRILRTGALSKEFLTNFFGPETQVNWPQKPMTPGQKYRHYAPSAKLLAVGDWAIRDESLAVAVLGFDDTPTQLPKISLGARHDLASCLKNLYACLRSLDEKNYATVLVDMNIQKSNLGFTLIDRLTKACAPH